MTSFLLLALLATAEEPLPQAVQFNRDIRPILAEACFHCHGPDKAKRKADLRLDTPEGALRLVVPGRPDKSELFARLTTHAPARIMPPPSAPRQLSARDIALINRWIDQGARWQTHWAFVAPQPLPIPAVRSNAGQNPIDTFLLVRLEKEGRILAPEADRATLLRRLSLDLLGLLPTPDEAQAFRDDPRPGAYERQVDRLLASPHFGERWGRHWLDLARYAESDGYENDRLRPDAWRFRDWVVRAVNDDMPFDRFTIEQLAGDLLPGSTFDQKVAAGFHSHTLWNSAASGDKEEFRTLAVKDRVDTTGLAWLGLTLGCAQCHSHKYDPVEHREYYRLYAFFNRTDTTTVKSPQGQSAVSLQAVPRETRIHLRGNFLNPGDVVTPGTPAFLPPMTPRGQVPDRLDLARWLVAPGHPLTARVAVNHFWQHLFGEGLVPTPENFGVNGSPPPHPELLDWLANEFQSQGWSRKAILRQVVLSRAYRQSSMHQPDDKANVLFSRQNRFRVEAEIVRDVSLQVGGLLTRPLGGPSIVPPFPEGLLEGKFTAEALKMPGGDRHRRGIYVHSQRTLPHPTLATFDGADGNAPCARRDRSITPLQALMLLNDPVFLECSRALGERLRTAPGDAAAKITFGFRLCLCRDPEQRERAVLLGLLERQRRLGASESVAWQGVARTILNLEEFTTRE